MKTTQNTPAPKANMRSARKSNKTTVTPSNEAQKNDKETSTGKKLVQARLPFKIIAGTPSTKPLEEATSSSSEVPSKKRKLSFTEETENQNLLKIGKSDSKENNSKIGSGQQDPISLEDDVIILDDVDKVSENAPDCPKTPISSVTKSQKKKNKSTPSNANDNANSTTPKLQIKLPLSGKKKRRKSKRDSLGDVKQIDRSDSSDVEFVSDEHENPQKKPKLEVVSKANKELVSKESLASSTETVDKKSPKTNADKKKKITPNAKLSKENNNDEQKEEPIELEPVQKTPKSSKPIKSNKKKGESPKNEGNESKITVPALSKPISKPESSQKLETTSSKTENDQKLTNIEKSEPTKTEDKGPTKKTSPKSISPKTSSPSKETRTSRRSLRVSEIEKPKKVTEEIVSSDVELVSESNDNAAENSFTNNNKVPQQTKLLTPKQQKLMEQRRKAREEKEIKLQQQKEEKERKLQEQREERERKLQEEKLQKQKEREERELQRKKEREEKEEQKRREREEKEDQRRKEKEDKEKKRLAELEAKNEEKRKKDEVKEEERRKKDEDRRRKELEKEEEENKKKKAAEAFTKFFVAKPPKPSQPEDDPESRDGAESVDSLAFRPFQVKGDMKLAPLIRREFKKSSREKLDSFLKGTLQSCKSNDLYIKELKNGTHTPLRGFKTVERNNFEDDDVVIIASELENAAQTIDEPRPLPIQTYRAKYFYFRENRRPPFYGTWRKKSTIITPRRPLATDKAFFDYEVDSDDEWEEEEPGESLNGSEDEKDESEDDDYEVDNEWFVPHGHLSDEELQNEDELGPDTSREAQKAKLKALQHEFAQEMKKKTEKIKPRLIGAIWEDENGNRPKLCPTIIWDSLCSRAMLFTESPLVEAPEVPEPEPSTPPPEKQQRIKIKDDLMKDLVRLVHGNRHSRVFLIKEYLEHVCSTCESVKNNEFLAPTKSQIKEKIDEIAEWSVVDVINKKNKNKKKLCWVVSADILDKHGLGELGLCNEWSYKLRPKFDTDTNDQDVSNPSTEDEPSKQESSKQTKTINSNKTEKKKQENATGIAKFTKVLTKNETKGHDTSTECDSQKNSPRVLKNAVSPKVKEVKNSTFRKPAQPPPPSAGTNKSPVVKKRVPLLMSVGPGQQFSPQSKNALISKFLQKNKTPSTTTAKTAKTIEVETPSKVAKSLVTKMDVDEVVVLD